METICIQADTDVIAFLTRLAEQRTKAKIDIAGKSVQKK